MKFDEPLYKMVWNMALLYQDKRNDEGHAETVVKYAFKLLKAFKEKICPSNIEIVILAAILHDIGHSQLNEEERMASYTEPRISVLKELTRYKHQLMGMDLASDILRRTNRYGAFSSWKMRKILDIILHHDTRTSHYSVEENNTNDISEDDIVRDADKLWRYSERGFEVAIKNRNYTYKQAQAHIVNLRVRIDEPGFFMTEEAKKIARRDIKKLKIPEWLKEEKK